MMRQVVTTDWKRGVVTHSYVDCGPARARVRGVGLGGNPAGGGYLRPGTKQPPQSHPEPR